MARAPKMTWERLREMISTGVGTGFGENYQPWLTIKRWNPSPISTQVVKPLPPYKRSCHFLSQSEYFLALMFTWVGCEIREQFPLWPWAHFHPEYKRNILLDKHFNHSNGMLNICKQAGINHGCFPGTSIPYIWTIDFMLHFPWSSNPNQSCAMLSVKPLTNPKFTTIDPTDRALEKLEGERKYAEELNIRYLVGDHHEFPRRLFGNLESIISCASMSDELHFNNLIDKFLDRHGGNLQNMPLSELRQILIKDYQCDVEDSIAVRNYLIWHQIIDVDLCLPLKEDLLPITGGKALKNSIRLHLEKSQ